jgi:hypothetical protein
MNALGPLLLVAAACSAYFAPLLTACIRGVPHSGSVIVINVFLGWTVIGWVIAMAMACRSVPRRHDYGSGPSGWPR